MENDNKAHSAPVKIEALDETLSESQATPSSPQLAVQFLVPESGCGNLDLPPSPPPLPLVSESMEMGSPGFQITDKPLHKKPQNMKQKPSKLSIKACKIEVETVPLVSGTAETDTHGVGQMEAQQMDRNYREDEVSDRSPAEMAPQGSLPRSLETEAPSQGQRGTVTQDTPSDQSSTPEWVFQDDGRRRCVLRRSLREVPEAWKLNGLELDNPESGVAAGKRKRSTKGKGKGKGKGKPEVRNGRGRAKPRDLAGPADRPVLMVVGDKEFTSEPLCKKVVSTVRVLTLANLPGPYRSYNMFPSRVRLEILRQFLQRYSWKEGEDVGQCLDVFERIAVEAYSRCLSDTRSVLDDKYQQDKEVWKQHPPIWCKNVEIWEGLCNIWASPIWENQSSTNRDNRTKKSRDPSHVGGSRSTFRHKQAMISEKGAPVDLKEVFDRTHMKKIGESKVYVNTRAHDTMAVYVELRKKHGSIMTEEALWELAAKGEKKGRLFGFGNKSRMSKANRELEAIEAIEASVSNPTKSTATSAEDCERKFTQSEVATLVAKELAAAHEKYAKDMEAQEKLYKAELEKVVGDTSFNKRCFDALFKHNGILMPNPGEGSSNRMASGGGVGGGEENQQ